MYLKQNHELVHIVYHEFRISLWKRFATKLTFFEMDLCTIYELPLPQYLFLKVTFGHATLSHLNQVAKTLRGPGGAGPPP